MHDIFHTDFSLLCGFNLQRFHFLVLSVCWLRYLIVTNRGPSIIIYANRKIALALYYLEVYDTCELDLVKKSISVQGCACVYAKYAAAYLNF